MKKSVFRFKDYMDKVKPTYIFVIGNDNIVGKMYKDYIDKELNTDKYIVVISELNMDSVIHTVVNNSNDCVILLCGNWYRNKVVKKHNLLDMFNNCYTIPIDEIER